MATRIKPIAVQDNSQHGMFQYQNGRICFFVADYDVIELANMVDSGQVVEGFAWTIGAKEIADQCLEQFGVEEWITDGDAKEVEELASTLEEAVRLLRLGVVAMKASRIAKTEKQNGHRSTETL